MLLPTKILPASPSVSSWPSSSKIFTTVAKRRAARRPRCLAEVRRGGDGRVGHLGRAVDVVEVLAELVHPVVAEVTGQRGPGGGDDLDLGQVVGVAGLLVELHDPLQHHRDHHERVAVLLDQRLQAGLGVELAPQHDRRAEQHRQREVRPAPGVEQRRGDVAAPPRPERQPREQRRGRLDAGLAARAPFGVPVVPEVRMITRLDFSGARWSPGGPAAISDSTVTRRRRRRWCCRVVDPAAPGRVSASSSSSENSSSCTTTFGLSRSRTSTSCGPGRRC